jgi:hypothetical protein
MFSLTSTDPAVFQSSMPSHQTEVVLVIFLPLIRQE